MPAQAGIQGDRCIPAFAGTTGEGWALYFFRALSCGLSGSPFCGLRRAPNLLRELDDVAELCVLLRFAEEIAAGVAGKAALRAEAHLIDGHVFAGFLDAPLDRVLRLERAEFRGDDAEHDPQLAFRHEAQRREIARARVVV